MQNGTGRRAMLSAIFALAWPTVVEQILGTAINYVDTFMVSKLGTDATATVGATMTVNWLIGSSVSALGIGFLAYISRALGARQNDLARRAAAQAVLAAIVTGAIITVLALSLSKPLPRWMQAAPEIRDQASRYFFIIYAPMLLRTFAIIFGTVLRASGDTRTPMLVNVQANVINVVLNFLLIYPTREMNVLGIRFTMFGMGMEVTGAAVGSAVAFAYCGILMTYKLYKSPVISPRGLSIKPDAETLKPCLKIALPAVAQRFVTSLGYVAFSAIINSLDKIATATHTIANTAESAFYIPGYGMQAAAATLAGRTVGEGDKDKMRSLTRMLLVIETLVMCATGALLFIGAERIMRIFATDPAVVRMGTTVLRMVALSEPIYGVAVILEGIFHGVGDTMSTFKFNVIGMWGIRILGTFICVEFLNMDLVAAWACMIAHNIAFGAMLCARYARGRWNPLNV